ncbi:MAG: SUMF1/EgtB/PvdO family nonheme iron enzyme, partial [Chloroflexi bacterium]|nr:SUMF1/EgtB/PvdO family nonheme iron enzyme [Chloroflexota bacterium]
DRRLAEAILQALVTTQETKAALDEAELVDELIQAQADFDPDKELETLRITRASLVNLRLLRSFQAGERPLVELAHDHMAAEIATWIDQAAMQAKLARELLRQQVESWQRHSLLIAPDALRLIHAQREHLRRLSQLEAELLLRSALAAGYEVPYWFERACQASVAAGAIALEGLASANFRTRAAAVTALGQLDDRFVDALIPMLADLYPQVRVAAIASLERLRPDGAWRKHLKYECYVPAGEFIMGDNEKEFTHSDTKAVAHRVHVGAFYIGKYPITNNEYQRFMADRGRGFDMPAGEERHPVVMVSWFDATDYAEWAGMRLLTEAEWEKAASWETSDKVTRWQGDKVMGKKRTYPWGDEFDKAKCNTNASFIIDTTPVDKYSPGGDSPCGCADMAGNVWEWCSSQYKDYPYRADDGRENLTEYTSRVQRGGSFFNVASDARCAARGRFDSYYRDVYFGFRVGWAAPSDNPWGTWRYTKRLDEERRWDEE